MSLSAAQRLALLPRGLQREWLSRQERWALEQIRRGDWWWTGRPEQFAPPGDWLVWLIMSGRGWGKSRTGAEWIIDSALRHPVDALGNRTEWLVIAERLNDCRSVCIEGNGGILSVLTRLGFRKGMDYTYLKSPQLKIEFKTGQLIYFEGADNADVGRGYNAAGLWADELAKWQYTYDAWYEGILPSLRAPLKDDHPRAIVTTTPKPIRLLIEWAHDTTGFVHITRGSTFDNRANLSGHVLNQLEERYAGTAAGRQELYGDLLEEIEGALWTRAQIEADRVKVAPELKQVVIAMDPGATGSKDETGLIAAGRGYDEQDYVLGDWSAQVVGHPAARRAWEMFREFGATWLVVEDNQGKRWLTTVLIDAYNEMAREGLFPEGKAPIKTVTSMVGKKLRAEPVASRYEQHRWHHVGTFTKLEDQQVTWVPGDAASPDRVDALVQAGLFLQSKEKRSMRTAAPDLSQPLVGYGSPYG